MRDDHTLYIHLHPYENEAREKELKMLDDWTVRDIRRLEDTIKTLKEYRTALYEHTRALQDMESHLQLKLKRERSYTQGKVFYYLSVKRVFPENDKMYQDILKETYDGTERHAALKRYDELKKQYPNIEAVKEIEKGRWEK